MEITCALHNDPSVQIVGASAFRSPFFAPDGCRCHCRRVLVRARRRTRGRRGGRGRDAPSGSWLRHAPGAVTNAIRDELARTCAASLANQIEFRHQTVK